MTTLPGDIDFVSNPEASPARMNVAMASIDARLRALETPRATFNQQLAQLQQIGLQRINDALQPYYQALKAIVSLGVLFNAASATALPIALGSAVFEISADDRDRFAHSGFMIAVSQSDSRKALMGRTLSYDRQTGLYTMDVVIASGTGSPSDWMIMPCVPPFVPAVVIDPGSDVQDALGAVPYISVGDESLTSTVFDPGTD